MRTTSLIIVILILLIIFWPTDPTQLDSGSPQTSRTGHKSEIQNTRVEKQGSTRVIRARSKKKAQEDEIDPYEDWELSKILSHFMVPPDEFRAGSINDSISKLKAIYREYSGHDLEISLEAPVQPNEAISFQHDNISFRTLLGMVAGLSGYSVEITAGKITFTTIKPTPARSAIVQSAPYALSKEAMAEILNTPEKTREYLSSLGLHTPEVFGFPDDQKELQNLIASLQDARLDPENVPRQVVVRNKLLSFPPGFEFEATEMSDTELQIAMRAWSQMEGVNIMTAPQVATLPGQDATIEIGKEIIYPDGQDPGQFVTEFVGLRMKTNPVLAGLDQIQLGGEIEFSSANTEDPRQLTEESFQSNITESEIHLYDGGHVLIPIIGEDGIPMIQIISSQRIDAAGRPFWPPKPK